MCCFYHKRPVRAGPSTYMYTHPPQPHTSYAPAISFKRQLQLQWFCSLASASNWPQVGPNPKGGAGIS